MEQIMVSDEEGVPCAWKEGRRYPLTRTYALCRCGKSENKPFCDGSHTKAGFEGRESRVTLEEKDVSIFEGPELVLTDIKPYCARARYCRRGRGIWELTVNPEGRKDREQAVEMASNCPAGRLLQKDRRSGKDAAPSPDPSIGVVSDPSRNEEGPLWVRGGIQIEGADGFLYERRPRVTLCRCGRSSIKPFCDGSHVHKPQGET